jgi:hypothetical protein
MPKVIGSGRRIEGGKLVTYKQDFNAHCEGEDFFHNADHIKMNPVLPSLSATDVQGTLEELQAVITSSGSGFISVGQIGGNVGSYNAGAVSTPKLADALTAAFQDDRLQNGGIVLILAGKYKLENTVSVPAGVTIIGEDSGSIIDGQMLEQPMFRIEQGSAVGIGGDSGSGDINLDAGSPLLGVRLANLVLADNLDGYIQSGGQPISSMQTTPMILCETSSYLVCDSVKFIGRVNNGPVSARAKTLKSIGYTNAGSTSSTLYLQNCFFDGMKIGFDFSPGNGNLDFLVVDNCRARTFGSESNPGDTTYQSNCFGLISNCNARLSDNYHIGAVSSVPTVRAMFVVNAATGGTDTKISLVNNSGGPTLSNAGMNILVDTTGSNLKTSRSGNNWGGSVQNDWFITVGASAPGGTSPSGDFIGRGAIDLVMALFGSSGIGPATVIVNPGSYNVTTNVASNLTFIGNKRGENYPVFNMQIATGVDGFGNRVFAPAAIKSIRFKCYIADTAVYHSISIPVDGHLTIIEDCIFSNCALTANASNPGNQDGDPQKQGIVVKNCHFYQDNDYTDNISLYLPDTDTVLIEECIFRNNGFIGGIGDVPALSLSSTSTASNITIKNCIFSLNGGSIDNVSPVTDFNNYFFINTSVGRVVIDGCQFLAEEDLTGYTGINNTMLNNGEYTKHIYISALDVYIKDSIFNGPEENYTLSAVSYTVPTLYIQPIRSLKFTNSRIVGGALPLQIGGSLAMSSTGTRGSIVVSGSDFQGANNSTRGTFTLIDIDIDLNSFTSTSHVNSNIIITDNTFYQKVASATAQIPHSEFTGADYNVNGVIQVYAPFFDVDISNNKMVANLRATTTVGSPYSHFTGIAVNNYNSVTLGAASTAIPFRVSIKDNKIKVRNSFSNASASTSSSAAWVRSCQMQIINNDFTFQNLVATNAEFSGCLYLDNPASTSTAYSNGLVTGNIFSRRNEDGSTTNLGRGYILVASTSGPGVIMNNSFSDSTYNNASTTLVEDNTTNDTWRVSDNKRQQEALSIKGNAGMLGLGLTSTGIKVATGIIPSVTASNVNFTYQSTTTNVVFDYNDTGDDLTATWSIPLSGLLPSGVYVTNVIIPVDITANPSTTSVATLAYRDDNSSITDNINPLTTAGGNLLLSFSHYTRRITPSLSPTVEVTLRINSSTTLDAQLGVMTILYQY